ncbi:axial regulator YABBY 4-like [Bidens hawaiensis]|uniref:axial regulator YABBY 4-like n=1 Tax=Bidens hawaiensis TaxID=980011 RepID=UPI00404B3B4F
MPMLHTPIFVLKYINVYAKYTMFSSPFLHDMSTLNHLVDLQMQEQICYVQCGFCTTVLLVCVPYRCLSMVVTVKCGHCTGFFPVNMSRSSFLPLHLLSSSVDNQEDSMVEACGKDHDEEVPKLTLSKHNSSPVISSSSSSDEDNDDDDLEVVNHISNKPPEKRQRAPSAYNQFIKDELRRLKTQHPNMTHKQAFSAAAKNWAHSQPSQQNEEEVKSKGSSGELGSDRTS